MRSRWPAAFANSPGQLRFTYSERMPMDRVYAFRLITKKCSKAATFAPTFNFSHTIRSLSHSLRNMSRLIRSTIFFLLIGTFGLQAQTVTPPLLPGETSERLGFEAMSAPNLLSLGIRVTSDFDDNALNDHNNNKQANSLTSVEPYVGWSLSVPRGRWSLDYRPGFSMGRPISIYDSRSELLDTNFSVTLTKRLQLRLRESLLKTKNAFDQLQQSDMAHGSSVLDRPNDSILAATREDSEQAGGDLSYALNARTVIGVSAAFYSVNYSSALNAQALGSAQSFGTHTFTSYQLTRHHWIGFDYNIQNLTSDRPQV